MNTRTVINMIVFQLIWFACIWWGNVAAAVCVVAGLGTHFWLVSRAPNEWLMMIVGATLGLSMDMSWQRLGLVSFADTVSGGLIPWLGVIWIMFMSTLNHSLAWLARSLPLAAVAGAIAAPLSYWAGVRMGAAVIHVPLWQFLMVLGTGWACLLPFLVFLMKSIQSAQKEAV